MIWTTFLICFYIVIIVHFCVVRWEAAGLPAIIAITCVHLRRPCGPTGRGKRLKKGRSPHNTDRQQQACKVVTRRRDNGPLETVTWLSSQVAMNGHIRRQVQVHLGHWEVARPCCVWVFRALHLCPNAKAPDASSPEAWKPEARSNGVPFYMTPSNHPSIYVVSSLTVHVIHQMGQNLWLS